MIELSIQESKNISNNKIHLNFYSQVDFVFVQVAYDFFALSDQGKIHIVFNNMTQQTNAFSFRAFK